MKISNAALASHSQQSWSYLPTGFVLWRNTAFLSQLKIIWPLIELRPFKNWYIQLGTSCNFRDSLYGQLRIIKMYYFSYPSFIFANMVYGLAFKRNHSDSYINKPHPATRKTSCPYCNNHIFSVITTAQKIIVKNKQTQISIVEYGFLVIAEQKVIKHLSLNIFSTNAKSWIRPSNLKFSIC